MNCIVKLLLVVIVLLVFIKLFLPSSELYEYFSAEVIRAFDNTSTVLYSQSSNDTDYHTALKNRVITNTELMIMDRCIEFNTGSIEGILAEMRRSFYISEKLVIQYSDFLEIEDAIKSKLVLLYGASNLEEFLGPIYILITQYPKIMAVSGTCTTTHIPLTSHELQSFAPFKVTGNNANNCDISPIIECEIYILMPSHDPSSSTDIVGSPNGKTWNDIKTVMSKLLEKPSDGILNIRSNDSKCFTTCGSVTNRSAYVCGARTGKTRGSEKYKSTVINNASNNMELENTKVDIANLYVLNTSVMNSIICPSITSNNTSSCKKFLNRHMDVQPVSVPTTYTAEQISVTEQQYITDISDMTPAEEKCYSKRHGIRGNSATIRKSWNDIGRTSGHIKKCTYDVLPISDEKLECYMYELAHKNNRTINSSTKDIEMELARRSYIDKYNLGEVVDIKCATPIDNNAAECYINRYNLDTNLETAKEHWRTKGFYDNKETSCHHNIHGTNFYKTLTEQEARCYQKNTDSLRYKDMGLSELKAEWLNESSQGKNKICIVPPELKDVDCYINRHTDLHDMTEDTAKTHWKEYGFYEKRSTDCGVNNIYKDLTEEEATCYKRKTPELRESTLTTRELSKHYFKNSKKPEDKKCLDVPVLSNEELNCYVNRNSSYNIALRDAQEHYNTLGAYIGLNTGCEGGRYTPISDAEAKCYNSTNNLNMTDISEMKKHWHEHGFMKNLSKRCPDIPNGSECSNVDGATNSCEYCSGGTSMRHRNGRYYCGNVYYGDCQRCNNAAHCNFVCRRNTNNHKCGNGNPNDCHCRRERDGSMCGRNDIRG